MVIERKKEDIAFSNEKNVRFTGREIDIISCLLAGRSSKKIASFLLISPKTVENHIRNIMIKLECNSRENIIDFLEKSEHLSSFKQHYSKILLKMAFELELKKIAKFSQKQPRRCLNIYYSSEKEKPDFIAELEKYLQMAGVIVHSYNWDPENLSNILIESQSVDHVIYSVSKDFAEKIKYFEGKLSVDKFNLNNIVSKKLEVILLLIESLEDQTYRLFQKVFANFIDASEKNNYYFFIFELLKKIFIDHDIEKYATGFKKQFDSFLAHPSLYEGSLANDIKKKFNLSSNLTNYIWNIKAILSLMILCLLVCVIIG